MLRRRALLLVNAKARQGQEGFEPALELLRERGFELLDRDLQDPTKIAEVIREAVGEVDLVILGGGDGTMNSAADVLRETGLTLGILPLGTANDLARTLQIPFTLPEACAVIADGREHAVDLGRANGKCFFNVASIGLSVQVQQKLKPELKRRWGVAAYFIALFGALRANRWFLARIRCGSRRFTMRALQVAVGNGRHYGGGMTVAEDAAIDDGRLDLYIIPPLPFWKLVLHAPAIRRGAHAETGAVRLLQGTNIAIRTVRPMPVNTDGELTTTTPVQFELLPAALKVMVPQDYAPPAAQAG